jgi:hypothetical protein
MPGTTALTVGNEFLASTSFNWDTEMRSSHHRDYPALDAILKRGMDKVEGGERMITSWDTTINHSRPTRHQHGYEALSDQALPVGTPGSEGWAFVSWPAYISLMDETKNRGKAAVLNIWKGRLKNRDDAFRKAFLDACIRGAVASGTWAGVQGFEDFIPWNGADYSNGFFEAASSGTNTVHNISRATYTVAAGHYQLHNLFQDVQDLAGTNLLTSMYALLPTLKKRNGEIKPNDYLGLASENVLGFLKRSLRSQEQYITEGPLDDGMRMAMRFHGIELIPEDLPSLGANTTAAPWSIILANIARGVRFVGQTGLIFETSDIIDIPGTSQVRCQVSRLFGQNKLVIPGLNAIVNNAEQWS